MFAMRRLPGRSIALVAVGGAAGALARVALSAAFPAGLFPWSTLAENLTGAFLLGGLLATLARRAPAAAEVRLLLGTGLLGGYTTFATVGLELHLLMAAGRPVVAGAYAAATVLGGMAAGLLGIAAGHRVPERYR